MAVWDVAARPAGEQFGYWREVICEAFVPLTPTRRRDTDGFASRVETRPLARVIRARIGSQPQRTTHGVAEVARTDGEFVFVNLQTAGTCAVEQGGRRSLVRAGQFTVVDTASPYHFEFDEPWGMVSYRVPHALLGGRLEAVRRGAAGCWDTGGAGAVVAAVMSSMWDLDAAGDVALDVEQTLSAAVCAALTERDGPPVDRHTALQAAGGCSSSACSWGWRSSPRPRRRSSCCRRWRSPTCGPDQRRAHRPPAGRRHEVVRGGRRGAPRGTPRSSDRPPPTAHSPSENATGAGGQVSDAVDKDQVDAGRLVRDEE